LARWLCGVSLGLVVVKAQEQVAVVM
jgi:hypothetical protein